MNHKPYPTRVDVRFEPTKHPPNRTRITLRHSGYGSGGTWDRSYEYFDRGWRKVLVRFEAYCALIGDGSSRGAHTTSPERRLMSEVIVSGSIEQVWSAWTTSEGMAAFFAPLSKIELSIGGSYELFIKPDAPEGSRGCEGCTVLSYQPMQMLSFSWNAPPSVPALRDANIRTRVVLYFDDLNDGRVKVTLNHLGFGEGEDWEECYAYFEKA